jgi:hypothetical protein
MVLLTGVHKNLTVLGPLLGPRKLRLFCCAVYRWACARSDSFESILALAERFADGKANAHELAAARYARRNLGFPYAWAVCWPPDSDALEMTLRAIGGLGEDFGRVGVERVWTDLLEEIAGHLLRSPIRIDPAWLAWEDGTVPRLARVLYDERDFDRLPILADAMEDAGCTQAGLLDHLRLGDARVHVRGCWALDAILGLE